MRRGFIRPNGAPRVNEQIFRQEDVPQNHAQAPRGRLCNNALKVLTIRMQNDYHDLIVAAAKEMFTAPPALGFETARPGGHSSVRENYFLFKEDIEQRRIRGQRNVSQRVNRGVAKNVVATVPMLREFVIQKLPALKKRATSEPVPEKAPHLIQHSAQVAVCCV